MSQGIQEVLFLGKQKVMGEVGSDVMGELGNDGYSWQKRK